MMYIYIIKKLIVFCEKLLDRLKFYEEMYEWNYYQGDLE